MTEVVEYKNCSKSECEAGRTGACAEGHEPLESCPFYGKASEIEEDFDDYFENSEDLIQQSEENQGNRDFIDLPSGEALDVAEVDDFLRWRPIKLVTIVGDSDSGKTTLICSIYDRFLHGIFAGHYFASSRTLIGLERRSHLSRLDSGLTSPDTPRTSYSDGVRFFHIAGISEGEQRVRTDLMLSDRAGEKYRMARDNSEVVSELFEVAKADRVVLLLDGARLAKPAERANAATSIRHTLRAFLDGGVLDETGCVQVVITKIDLIEILPESDKEIVHQFIRDFKDKLRDKFENRVGELTFFDIAARDPTGRLAPAYGVDQLLANWFDRKHQSAVPVDVNALPLKREFDLLLARTPMEMSI